MDSGIAIHNIVNHTCFRSEFFDVLSQGTWDGVHGWTMTLLLLLVLCCSCACTLFCVSAWASAGERTTCHYRGMSGTSVWGKLWGTANGLLWGFNFRRGTDATSEHQKSYKKNLKYQRARKGTKKQHKTRRSFVPFLGVVILGAVQIMVVSAGGTTSVRTPQADHHNGTQWTKHMVAPTPTYTYGSPTPTPTVPTPTHRPTCPREPWLVAKHCWCSSDHLSAYDLWSHDHHTSSYDLWSNDHITPTYELWSRDQITIIFSGKHAKQRGQRQRQQYQLSSHTSIPN